MAQNKGETILVVDDDALSRRMLVRSFRTLATAVASPGAARMPGPNYRRSNLRCSCSISNFPGLNGADLLKRLRVDPNPEIAQIPTIMLTGHGGEESEVRCLEAGANDFVTKPINLAVLRARIETQLRLRSLRRQLQRRMKNSRPGAEISSRIWPRPA